MSPEVKRPRRNARQEPKPYDFRRSTKLSRKHVRSLQIVFETFARQWATLLTSSLRTLSQVGLVAIEELTYDEYVSRLRNPTMVNVLSMEPLAGAGVLGMSMADAMVSVDRLLGGPGTGTQPERALSDIESGLLRQLVGRVLGELRYAFEPIVRMEPAVKAVEYNPQFVQAAAAADVFVVATFEMRLGAQESAATVALPFAGLFPHLEASLGVDVAAEAEKSTAAALSVEDRLPSVPVDVSVGFRPTALTPRTLISLAVGDVVTLTHPVAAPLVVTVPVGRLASSPTAANVTFAHAVAGARGRRLACLVVGAPDPEPEPGCDA